MSQKIAHLRQMIKCVIKSEIAYVAGNITCCTLFVTQGI